MKTLALSLILVASSSALACPDFSGKYSCSSKNGPTILVEYRKTAEGYHLEDPPVVQASKEGIDQISEGMGLMITTTGLCRGNNILEVRQVTQNAATKKYLGQVVKTYRPLANGDLEIQIKAEDDKTKTDLFVDCLRRP